MVNVKRYRLHSRRSSLRDADLMLWAWVLGGTAIFSDDLAADVRSDWREGILDGKDPSALASELIASYAHALADSDESVVFWLALAAAQQETGRLQESTRDRALELIGRGGDVARWEAEDGGLAAQRSRALEALRAKLAGTQPAPKRLRRPAAHGVPFEKGDAILLTSPRGKRAVAVVVGHQTGWPKGTMNPVVEILLWDDNGDLPSRELLAKAPPLHTDTENPGWSWSPRIRPELYAVTTARKEMAFGDHLGRVIAKGVPREPAGDYTDGSVMTGAVLLVGLQWRALAASLDNDRFEHKRQLTRCHTQGSAARPSLWTWLRRSRGGDSS